MHPTDDAKGLGRAIAFLMRYPIGGILYRNGVPVAYLIKPEAQPDGGHGTRADLVEANLGRIKPFPPLPKDGDI